MNLLKSTWGVLYSVLRSQYKERKRKHKSIQKFLIHDLKNPGHYYSLAPFDYYQCIFVHIPKTGGISVSESLFGNAGGVHTTIQQYQRIFPPTTFKKYFKFAFVRNPWDRVVSAYFFLKAGGMHEEDKKWSDQHLAPYASFKDFVKGWINEENVANGIHFLPQSHFLRDSTKRMPLDFIGRFENLGADFGLICKKLGLERNLLHKNKSERKHYSLCYDAESIEIIRRVYKEDIQLFEYSYEHIE